jgi:hypothetical protein
LKKLKRLLAISIAFFLLFGYGLTLNLVSIRVIEDSLEPRNPDGYYDYKGAINVHTKNNQGSGSLSDIVQSAIEASLDFVVLTDLNHFQKEPASEGYHRQLLVVQGGQYNYLDSRLTLIDGEKPRRFSSVGEAQTVLADLLSQSGEGADKDLILLSHPFRDHAAWTRDRPSGLDGLEIVNLKAIWEQAWSESKISFLWSLIVYPFNSQLAFMRLYQEPKNELRIWDELASSRQTIGIAASEATSRAGPLGNLYINFPSYQTFFSLVSNHVLLPSELTGEAVSDRRKVLQAISEGRFYLCLDPIGNSKGFNIWIKDGSKVRPMGSKMKWRPGLRINAKIPAKPNVPFEISFLKDGQPLMSIHSTEGSFETQGPGVYRVIVRVFKHFSLVDGKRWVTWIYSNPFYLK